jgi:hypothetical protein
MRIERQQNERIELMRTYRIDGGLGERVPVTHGDEAARIEIARERLFESARLKFREPADGRLATDGIVVFANDAGAATGDPARQGTSRKPTAEEINNVRIAEKIVEERLDRLGRVGPAELEKNDAEPGFGHDFA